MKPVPDWRDVLRHAWSVRLWALAILLELVAAFLPLADFASIKWAVVAFLAAKVCGVAGFVARFIAQKEFEDGYRK